MPENVMIAHVGMFTPVGLDAEMTAASLRAGVGRFEPTSFMDERLQPITMSFLPHDALPPLHSDLAATHLGSLRQRLLRYAGQALVEACHELRDEEPLPLFLAGPGPNPRLHFSLDDAFLAELGQQADCELDLDKSRLFLSGRAGVFEAVKAAVNELPRASGVVVGGVDSYWHPVLLGQLMRDKRLACEGVMDGLVPGEGAAFLVLNSSTHAAAPLARLVGVGLGKEPGHLRSDQPYRGDGLTAAFSDLFTDTHHSNPIHTVFAGFTGESFFAKEWGVAQLRHHEQFAETLQMEHSAEYIGDAGAALAAIMLSAATLGVRDGYLASSVLVWAASDEAERGAAIIDAVA